VRGGSSLATSQPERVRASDTAQLQTHREAEHVRVLDGPQHLLQSVLIVWKKYVGQTERGVCRIPLNPVSIGANAVLENESNSVRLGQAQRRVKVFANGRRLAFPRVEPWDRNREPFCTLFACTPGGEAPDR